MISIGISGWIYPSWRGSFYPPSLPQRQWLAYASRRFPSIEVNSTFYSLKTPASFRRWQAETPRDFVFALKGPRFITHMKKLKEVEQPLATFFAQGLLALGAKLGPILWQLPATMPFDAERIEGFLALLPRDTTEAARLAERRNRRILKSRTLLEPAAFARLRHAFEVRHESFRDPRFATLLRRGGAALAVSDAPEWPRFETMTADFAYLRLHGSTELYTSGYDPPAIAGWARRVRRWAAAGHDVYVYFDNDAKIRAPADALALAERLGLTPLQGAPSHPPRENTARGRH